MDGASQPDLRIDGYLGGAKVASRSFSCDPSRDRLLLASDDAGLTGDGADETRVVVRAVDAHGNPRPYVTGQVQLSVHGPAMLVGDNPFDFTDTGGAGAVWLRTLPNSPGTVTLRASHPTLGSAAATVQVTAPVPGGAPAPYAAVAVTSAPKLVTPGETTKVTAAITNNGLLDLTRLTLAIQVPAGWAAAASTPTTLTNVGSGQQVQAGWQVTVPAGAAPGTATVTVRATYTSGAQRGVTDGSTRVLVAYPSLASAVNNVGISDDSDVFAANLDGVGNSYSEQALTGAGLGPGVAVTHDGISFTWPDMPAGRPDNVVAEGQTIMLAGSGATLGFLGAGSPANEAGKGTVYYTDGSTSSYTVTLDNWWYAPLPENDTIAKLPYVNDSNPASNGGTAGQRNHTVYVFYAGVPLTPGKTVRAVTLPAGGSVPSSGRISGLHLFALAVG